MIKVLSDKVLNEQLVYLATIPRSPKWPAVEHKHLKEQPFCKYCGHILNLQVHHIKPFHLYPELELDDNNLITLCMEPSLRCHLIQGHLGSWFKYNPNIVKEATISKAI